MNREGYNTKQVHMWFVPVWYESEIYQMAPYIKRNLSFLGGQAEQTDVLLFNVRGCFCFTWDDLITNILIFPQPRQKGSSSSGISKPLEQKPASYCMNCENSISWLYLLFLLFLPQEALGV